MEASSSSARPVLEPLYDFGQALAEANRCLLCHDPPCSRGCPGGTDPGRFIRQFRLRNVTGAIRTIKQNNILGGACGVLCPTARLCERECSASGIERPIRIGRLQRFLVEHGRAIGFDPLEPVPLDRESVAVVGSGPAGLAAAAELARGGHPVTVFEERASPGGVLAHAVPEERFPARLLEPELADLRRLGVRFRCDHPIRGTAAVAELRAQYAAVFLGPGCWAPQRLPPASTLVGVRAAPDFLEELRQGRRADLTGRTVAVLGGGSVAIDCATAALRRGATDVYLVYRRSYVQMPAEAEERQAALDQGVHFLLLQQPVGYVADEAGQLTGLQLRRTRLGEPDGSGRRAPVELPGTDWILDVDLVLEALGAGPTPATREWAELTRDARGCLQVDPETGQTTLPGVFAGGDIVRGPALIIQAIRDGKQAARAIERYLAVAREGHHAE